MLWKCVPKEIKYWFSLSVSSLINICLLVLVTFLFQEILSPDIWGRARENGEQPFLQADRHHPFLYLFFELTFPVNTDPVQAVQMRRINGTDLAGANTLHIQVSLLVVITRGKWPVALLATFMQTFRQKESTDTIGVSLLVHHLDSL